jgi:hypothetical protein
MAKIIKKRDQGREMILSYEEADHLRELIRAGRQVLSKKYGDTYDSEFALDMLRALPGGHFSFIQRNGLKFTERLENTPS